MKELIKRSVKKLPYLRRVFLERERLRIERDQLKAERDQLRVERDSLKSNDVPLWVPLGHFHSPIPSISEIKLKEKEIFHNIPRQIPGVDMNEGEQLELLEVFKEYYKELPFEKHKKKDVRYFFENIAFTYGDAITLFCMIRHVRPKRIIEVGSGYSSCVILDTNELFFDNSISCAFIEPYPERFYSLLLDSDKSRIEIIPKKLQDVDLSKFSDLSQGDFLFIDSTHVSKINSDVNHVFFNVLPSLATGVYIHFHDIGYPFEYPKQWVYEGKGWNEAYLARAFLQYNTQFKIQFHSSFLHAFHKDKLLGAMPLYSPNAGCSIWIKKL